jgi:hypothetical protein
MTLVCHMIWYFELLSLNLSIKKLKIRHMENQIKAVSKRKAFLIAFNEAVSRMRSGSYSSREVKRYINSLGSHHQVHKLYRATLVNRPNGYKGYSCTDYSERFVAAMSHCDRYRCYRKKPGGNLHHIVVVE